MKRILFNIVLLLLSFVYLNCSNTVNNSITFQNLSSGDVYINFRGQMITARAGTVSSVKQIPNGTYSYATTFSAPAGVSSITTQGNVTGTLQIKVATKILFVYSSTNSNGTYTVSVTMSNSDNQGSTTITGP